jgi:hypothetical protein
LITEQPLGKYGDGYAYTTLGAQLWVEKEYFTAAVWQHIQDGGL